MARRDPERGSISVFATVIVMAILVVMGLVVEGGGRLEAMQRADAIAREAARAAGQALDPSTAPTGAQILLAQDKAVAAGQAYLAAQGVPGTITVSGSTVHATATVTYTSAIFSFWGPVSIVGAADAQATRVLNGAER